MKSPSSFSSSVDAPESGTLGSSLCLQKVRVIKSEKFREGKEVDAGWGTLTSPWREPAASGAGSGTSGHCGPTFCPQAEGQQREKEHDQIFHTHVVILSNIHTFIQSVMNG